jgi:cytochrome c heme-lyase
MHRKGWQPREVDMPWVVSIHNTVNEQCWRKVMEYEKFHPKCLNPKLLKFRGRPNDLSPKARLSSYFGYVLPFDRHDWIVDRCGTQVRYVIDFYEGPPDPIRPVSVHLDVRPAVSWMGLVDRARMNWKTWTT